MSHTTIWQEGYNEGFEAGQAEAQKNALTAEKIRAYQKKHPDVEFITFWPESQRADLGYTDLSVTFEEAIKRIEGGEDE